MTLRRYVIASALLLLTGLSSWAAIVLGGRATNGTLDNSGTNKNPVPFNLGSYTGRYSSFLGTVIGPRHFITAEHIGNGAPNFFYSNGGGVETEYTVTRVGVFNDLAIFEINGPGTFTHWAPLYRNTNEVGQQAVVIGNGTIRGNPVNTPSTSNLAGWEWGGPNTLRSWGTNTIDAVVNINIGPPFQGQFLYFTFGRQLDGGGNVLNPDEAVLSGGDSGGPVFVLDPLDSQWKLAAINSLVDQISQTPNGTGFPAALFDARGFFDGATELTGPDPIPLGSYSTRISSRLAFIDSIAAVPEPSSILMIGGMVLGGGVYFGYRRRQQMSEVTL